MTEEELLADWLSKNKKRPKQIKNDKKTMPTEEHLQLARYLIVNLKAVTPNFEEPFSESSWADRIGEIGYPTADIRLSIDWLFSNSGKWFLKNVPDAWHFKKHFKTINEQRKKAFFEDTEESLILQIQALEKRLQELRSRSV